MSTNKLPVNITAGVVDSAFNKLVLPAVLMVILPLAVAMFTLLVPLLILVPPPPPPVAVTVTAPVAALTLIPVPAMMLVTTPVS